MDSIGFLEVSSIARGIQAVDYMLKTADVKLVFARPCCPGKYNILVTGELSAVESSVAAGDAVCEEYAVSRLIIPRLHPQVIAAMQMTTVPTGLNAVGIIECFSLTAAIWAADTAVKAADITLLELRLGTGVGGKSFVVMTGDVAAVEEGVRSGAVSAINEGMLISQVVIPNPHQDLFLNLY